MSSSSDALPVMLESPNLDELRVAVGDYLRDVYAGEPCDRLSDHKHFLFETVVEAFYGPGIWDKINSRLD